MVYPPIDPDREPPIEVEGAPVEEELSVSDVADRIDEDPEEERNLTDQDPDLLAGDPDDSAPDLPEDT